MPLGSGIPGMGIGGIPFMPGIGGIPGIPGIGIGGMPFIGKGGGGTPGRDVSLCICE